MNNTTSLPGLAAPKPEQIINGHNQHSDPFAVDANHLLDESDAPFSFLVQGLLHRVGLACLAGTQDAGKSCLLRQLAIAVAAGDEQFLGWQLNTRHRSAVYVTTEDGREATRCLLRRQAEQYPKEQLSGLRFVFDDGQLMDNLDRSLERRPADLVVIDCFADVYDGNPKNAQRVRSFLHQFQLLAERRQCLVLFLHHTDLIAEYCEPDKNLLLNNEGFNAKMRLVLELRTDLHHPERRHLCVVKGHYLPSDTKSESYVLQLDERTLTYTQTNERSPFEMLMQKEPNPKKKIDIAGAKWWEAYKMKRDERLSYRQIAEKMGYSSKSSVAAIFQRGRDEGWENDIRECYRVDTNDIEETGEKQGGNNEQPGKAGKQPVKAR